MTLNAPKLFGMGLEDLLGHFEGVSRINVLDEYIPLRKSFEEKGYEVIWNALEPKKIIVKTTKSISIKY